MNILKNNNSSITEFLLFITIIAAVFSLLKIFGCTSENPIIENGIENPIIENSLYKWEYVPDYLDTTKWKITDVKATDSKINIWWTSYGEVNVNDYAIQYLASIGQHGEEIFEFLGRRTGKGTRPDTIDYFFWADFEVSDSLKFRIKQTHFDGTFYILQFIVIRLFTSLLFQPEKL